MDNPLINISTPFDAVVLANGDKPRHPLSLGILTHARHIVCCDSAFENLDASLINKVEAIVGDGDSLNDAFKQQYAALLHIESEQDNNDLTKATRYCMSKGYQRIAYLGITGKREDHTIGNIALLADYLRRYRLQPVGVTDYGTFVPCEGDALFESFARQQVSIFNFTCKKLSNDGLQWPSYAYETWWQGTLNESLGHRFTIYADGCYLVYRTHDAKCSDSSHGLCKAMKP